MTPAPAATPPPQLEFVSPPDAEDYLDTDNDDVKLRYRNIDNILSAVMPPGLAVRQVAAALHLQIEDEPATFSEAIMEPRHVGGHRVHREQQDMAAGDSSPWTPSNRIEVGLQAQEGRRR
jgi:hypothetical protein